jgi:hypothetical protein
MAIKMPPCNESTDDGMVGQQGIWAAKRLALYDRRGGYKRR